MFLTYTDTRGVVPKWLKLFILKSSLIKVKESKDASHRQEKRPYRRNHFPTRSVPDHLHLWLFSPGSVCEGLGCSTPRGPAGPSFSAVSWGTGEAPLQPHLLKAGPYSSATTEAPSSVTWSVFTHTPTGMCTCELRVPCTGNEASRPACLLSLRPLSLPAGMAAPKGSGVVAGCSGSGQGPWDVVMRSGRALGVYYMGSEAGTSDVHAWFGPVCDYAKANTLLILSPQVRHMDFFLKMGMTRVHCGFFFFF